MNESPKFQHKLPIHFVEEAGVRFFEKQEGKDWYDAIRQVLWESGIDLSHEKIRELFLNCPDTADDEDFELGIVSYLFKNGLITKDQVEGEEWEHLFLRLSELAQLDEQDLETVVAQAQTHREVNAQINDDLAAK